MNKINSALAPQIRRHIESIKSNTGLLNVAECVDYVRDDYYFDADAAKEREMARYVRQIYSTFRDSEGDRIILATGRSGEFIDREICKDNNKLRSAILSMTEMRDGLNRTIRKAQRQVDGQISLFEQIPHSSMHAAL